MKLWVALMVMSVMSLPDLRLLDGRTHETSAFARGYLTRLLKAR